MLGAHAKCEAKRTRGVGGAERRQVDKDGEIGRDKENENSTFGDRFAPMLRLVLGPKRGRWHGWRDKVMLGAHAKCEAKRTRGVGGRARWQGGREYLKEGNEN